ncbi:Hpt domain-containing protein [Vibrio sp. SM6]|uniref:Hpt domain-containing protein n=1 Tax=Vibrio agarilyticus TaxID=2726741 RepID=A0A7X8TQJ3_9VIBR|nr:Hpt domain-containing protein [Vibrio agarilyticus]NLS12915.1 Hpt domain-containing protein [Vibrio agarilyticus]
MNSTDNPLNPDSCANNGEPLDGVTIPMEHMAGEPCLPNNIVLESTLEQLVKDTSAQLVTELIGFYLEDTRARLLIIELALKQRDRETLEFEVHTLGSTAAAHGNQWLCDVCRDIEAKCLSHHTEEAMALAQALPGIVEVSLDKLTQRAAAGFRDTHPT